MDTRVPKESSSVGELKDYLSLRGLSVTGKKRELIARAFSACEPNVRVVVSDEELKSRLTVEYQQRFWLRVLLEAPGLLQRIDGETI